MYFSHCVELAVYLIECLNIHGRPAIQITRFMFIIQGFDELGGLLKPTVASQNQSLPVAKVPPNKLVSDDLDSSLANLVGSKY